MIPTSSTSPVSTSATDLREFTIADSGVLIELLSSKLYTDKIGSFVREIGTNAIDANIANNYPDQPITINILVEGAENTLIGTDTRILIVEIGDSGPGMPPELIQSKLAVLGESTKDSDNLAHGGFGIGFLTTLAISRSIEIDSHHQGTLYKYRICEQAGQQVAIYLVSSAAAPGVGTIVRTWIDRDDADDVEQTGRQLAVAVGKFACFLPVKPVITSSDWSVFSANYLDRQIAEVQTRWLCGDQDYTYYLKANPANERFDNVARHQIDARRMLVVCLGSVAYGWGRSMVIDEYDRVPPTNSWRVELREFCKNLATYRFNGPCTDNILVLQFEIGELEVSSSREALTSSAANAAKILAKLELVVDRLRLVFASRLNHRVANPGIFGDYLIDYFNVAMSWGLRTIEIDQVPIDLRPCDSLHWGTEIEWVSYWEGQGVNHSGSIVSKDIFHLVDTLTKQQARVVQLLGAILQISRDGQPQILMLTGASADKSMSRIISKAEAAHPDLNLSRTIILDARTSSSGSYKLIDGLPWLKSFAQVFEFELPAPKVKLPSFNSRDHLILIWLDLRTKDCPARRSFNWRGQKDDEPEFPRLTRTEFIAQAALDKPIYYFQADTFSYPVFDRFQTALRLFKIKRKEVYILGAETVYELLDRGYNLQHAWCPIIPLVKTWTTTVLDPVVTELGFVPGCSQVVGIGEVGLARIAFLASPPIRKLIKPQQLWLVDWLVKNGEISAFVLERFTTEDALKGFPPLDYNHRQQVALLITKTTVCIKTLYPNYRDGDTHLFFTLRLLLADLLSSLPIMNALSPFNPNPSSNPESAVIASILAEVESGSLKRWAEQKQP
jgi:Histidine kinase-, DNA gyrase B-, and HSP90-like ATPase